jgi:hypothetical protein
MQEKAAFTNKPCVGSVYAEDDVVKDKMEKVKDAKSHGKQCSTMFCIGQNLYACKYLVI